MIRYLFQLSLKMLWHKKTKMIFTSLAVAMGISLLVSMIVLYDKMDQSVRQSIKERYGDVEMLVGYRSNKMLDGEQIRKIQAIEGIKSSAVNFVNPHNFTTAYDGRYNGNYYVGVDNQPMSKVYNRIQYDLKENEVVLSEKLANELGVRIGEAVDIPFPSGQTLPRIVKDIIPNMSSSSPINHVIFHLGSIQSALGLGQQANLLLLDLEDGMDTNQLAILLKSEIDESLDIDIVSEYDAVKANIQSLAMIGIVLGSLAMVTCGLFVMSNIQLSIWQRQKELATLRAIGATNKALIYLVLFEAVIIQTIGIIIGFGAGILFSNLFAQTVSKWLQLEHLASSDLPLLTIFIVCASSWLLLLIVSLFPTFKVSKMLLMQVTQEKKSKRWGVSYIIVPLLKVIGTFALRFRMRLTYLAAHNLIAQRKQKLGVILLLSSTLSLIIVGSSILNMIKYGAESTVKEQYITDLLLKSKSAMQSSLPYQIVEDIENIKDIQSAVPYSVFYGGWMDSVYMNYFVSDIGKMIDNGMIERIDIENKAETILIPEEYATEIGLQTGNTITIRDDHTDELAEFTVVTIQKIPGWILQDKMIIDHTSSLLKKKDIRVYSVLITVEPGQLAMAEQGLSDLHVQYPEIAWGSLDSELRNVDKQVNQRFGIVWAVLAMLIMISIFGSINTFSAVIHHYRREYAILRAIHLTPSGLMKLIVMQGLLISLLAILIGSSSGIILAYILAALLGVDYEMKWSSLIIVMLIVICIGLFVSGAFAYRLSSKRITEELAID